MATLSTHSSLGDEQSKAGLDGPVALEYLSVRKLQYACSTTPAGQKLRAIYRTIIATLVVICSCSLGYAVMQHFTIVEMKATIDRIEREVNASTFLSSSKMKS